MYLAIDILELSTMNVTSNSFLNLDVFIIFILYGVLLFSSSDSHCGHCLSRRDLLVDG
jgi:hypothetical protein